MKILLGAGVGSFSWIPAVYLFLYDCVPKVATIDTHKLSNIQNVIVNKLGNGISLLYV